MNTDTYVHLPDGLYQVTSLFICAGFVVRNERVVACAPILRKRLVDYWVDKAKRVGP